MLILLAHFPPSASHPSCKVKNPHEILLNKMKRNALNEPHGPSNNASDLTMCAKDLTRIESEFSK